MYSHCNTLLFLPGKPSLWKTLPVDRREFFVSGVFRLITELAKISAPMLLRELILHVKGEATVVPNSVPGGLALALILFLVVLVQACALQHFIHGGLFCSEEPNTYHGTCLDCAKLQYLVTMGCGLRQSKYTDIVWKNVNQTRQIKPAKQILWAVSPRYYTRCFVVVNDVY